MANQSIGLDATQLYSHTQYEAGVVVDKSSRDICA